jgi:tryptophan synthase alpha chain
VRYSSSNRIDQCFAQLRKEKRKAFVAYITAGDPNLATTARLARSFEKAGVDVLELGVPFSDPLADGVVNQLAADRAIKAGTTLSGILRTVQKLRRDGMEMPIVLFTYFNPIHRYGLQRFIKDAIRSGVDGVLNLDLPPEESDLSIKLMEKNGLHSIHLIAPNTPSSRIRSIAQKSRGFIYYVSREGVTGMRKNLAEGISSRIHQIQRNTQVPVVVGFGISSPGQVQKAAEFADGCVVGSAIVQRICELNGKSSLVPQVTRFVSSLVKPLR